MRKIILTLCISLCVAGMLKAQEKYKVIKVNGTIKVVETGVSLTQGILFEENNQLNFATSNARAAVINPNKGRFIITENSHNLASAGSNFLPAMNNISSRAGAILTMQALQNHFSGDYVIIGKTEIELNAQVFPMDNDNFFHIQYQYNGELINKKLGFVDDSLLLIKSSIYKVDDKPIESPDNQSVKLFYRNNGASVLVSEFNLILPNVDELKAEVQIILSELQEKSMEEKKAEVNGYISEFYGTIDIDNLNKWLKANFNDFN